MSTGVGGFASPASLQAISANRKSSPALAPSPEIPQSPQQPSAAALHQLHLGPLTGNIAARSVLQNLQLATSAHRPSPIIRENHLGLVPLQLLNDAPPPPSPEYRRRLVASITPPHSTHQKYIQPPSLSTNPMLSMKLLLHLQPRMTHRPRKRKASAIGCHCTTHTSLNMMSFHCRSRFGTAHHYEAAPPHKQHPPPKSHPQLNFSRVKIMLRLLRSNCTSQQMLQLPGGQPRLRKRSTRIRCSSSNSSSSSSNSTRKIGNNRSIVINSSCSINNIISLQQTHVDLSPLAILQLQPSPSPCLSPP